MRTTWRVVKVTETEGTRLAELQRVEWYKPNPLYVARMAEYDAWVEEFGREEADRRSLEAKDADTFYDEFLEAEPGEEGAEFFAPGNDSLTLDVFGGLDLRPGDNVSVTLDAVERVPA